MLQEIFYPSYNSVYREMQICGSEKKLNIELWICKLLHEILLLYLWFTALIRILPVINSNDRNTTFMMSIKFMTPTVLVK